MNIILNPEKLTRFLSEFISILYLQAYFLQQNPKNKSFRLTKAIWNWDTDRKKKNLRKYSKYHKRKYIKGKFSNTLLQTKNVLCVKEIAMIYSIGSIGWPWIDIRGRDFQMFNIEIVCT